MPKFKADVVSRTEGWGLRTRQPDADPNAMRRRRETVEPPFDARMGATHVLTRTMPKVATEMALAVLAYNFTRVMNILGVRPLIAAMRA
jgi:hypothetical protein